MEVVDHDDFVFRPDLYTIEDFPYDDYYFESYHHRAHSNQREEPPMPMAEM